MSKTYLPYDPDQQLLLPAALREWLPRTIWPTSSLTLWTSWTPAFARAGSLGDHGVLRAGKARWPAL